MDSIKDFVEDNSTEKKIFLAILFAGVAWLGYEVYSVVAMNKNRKKSVGNTKHEMQSSNVEVAPIEMTKPRELIQLFVKRMSQDQVLAKFFHPRMFQPHSLYALILEKYMTSSLEGKEPEMPLDMRTVHKGIHIKKEHFDRWVQLWRSCEDEIGIHAKPDIWKDIESKIVKEH